jgi:hypothetical protein
MDEADRQWDAFEAWQREEDEREARRLRAWATHMIDQIEAQTRDLFASIRADIEAELERLRRDAGAK